MKQAGGIVDTILYITQESDQPVRLWLQNYIESLQVLRTGVIDKIISEIIPDAYVRFERRNRQSTITSFFGKYIGKHQSGMKDDTIVYMYRHLMIVNLMLIFTPKRWAKTVQFIIRKYDKCPWMHIIRILEFFNFQLNTSLQMPVRIRLVYSILDKDLLK